MSMQDDLDEARAYGRALANGFHADVLSGTAAEYESADDAASHAAEEAVWDPEGEPPVGWLRAARGAARARARDLYDHREQGCEDPSCSDCHDRLREDSMIAVCEADARAEQEAEERMRQPGEALRFLQKWQPAEGPRVAMVLQVLHVEVGNPRGVRAVVRCDDGTTRVATAWLSTTSGTREDPPSCDPEFAYDVALVGCALQTSSTGVPIPSETETWFAASDVTHFGKISYYGSQAASRYLVTLNDGRTMSVVCKDQPDAVVKVMRRLAKKERLPYATRALGYSMVLKETTEIAAVK